MLGASRYTTRGRGGWLGVSIGAVLSVARRPAAIAAGLFLLCGYGLGVPGGRLLLAGLGVMAAVAGRSIYRSRLSPSAPIAKAMTELGLVFRHDDGRLETPSVRGRLTRNGPNVRLRWRLPPGVTLRHVLERQEAIEHRCACELTCVMADGGLVMEVLRHPIPRLVTFNEFYGGPRPHGELLLGLGRGRRGALWLDLASLPHLLVGGMTGGGKSAFLSQALTFLASEYRPHRVRLTCIDLKGGVELARFGELPHALHRVTDSIEGAAGVLGEIRVELDRRMEALRRAGLRDISAWLDAGMPDWPRIVVVVDEVAELTVRELGSDKVVRAAQQAAIGRLTEIARLGRAAGVHLIVCTQRPDAEAVPGQLKANFAGTVAFRVRSGINSLILLDNDRAALLPPHPGRGIWAHDRNEEFQAVFISPEYSSRLLDERWGSRLLPGTTGPVTPWCQSPEEAAVDIEGAAEEGTAAE